MKNSQRQEKAVIDAANLLTDLVNATGLLEWLRSRQGENREELREFAQDIEAALRERKEADEAVLEEIAQNASKDGDPFETEPVPGHPKILRVTRLTRPFFGTEHQIGAMLLQIEEPDDEDPDRRAWHVFDDERRRKS